MVIAPGPLSVSDSLAIVGGEVVVDVVAVRHPCLGLIMVDRKAVLAEGAKAPGGEALT